MLNATTFTFDGVFSGKYGMVIAEIHAENIQQTTPFAPVIRAVKTPRQRRFSFAGIEYEDMPQFTFHLMCEDPIPDIVRREMLAWLVGRNGFRKLQIHQPDYDNYTYNCIFETTQIIFVNGWCHGFVLTATFDSPYAYGRPSKAVIKSDGTDDKEVLLVNESDLLDDYTFPIVKFRANDLVDGMAITIINTSDAADPHRAFEFIGKTEFGEIVTPIEVIEVDNELKTIVSSLPGDRLNNFNRNWVRLVKGPNKLKVRINGECTIICLNLVKIGF